jgi:aryl-alcohol dehydrogenase-like predicted oxidoreductase
VDTASNYADGASERVVGSVLNKMFAAGELLREEVVIVTKCGYVQGSNLALAHRKKKEGMPFPEMVEFHPDCWHCISPAFLEDQITRSLERLGVDQIDVFLLHNPEHFLKVDPNPTEYYRRIGEAFAYLEKEAGHGRIQYYGISSNTFIDPKTSPDYTSLETVTELATKSGPKNRFAVVQMPFNLIECGAAVENNNSHETAIEFAERKKLGVLTNRPLNAFYNKQLIRLSDFESFGQPKGAHELQKSLMIALHEESNLEEKGMTPPMTWAKALASHHKDFGSLAQWRDVADNQLKAFLEGMKTPEQAAYRQALVEVVEALTESLGTRESDRAERIVEAILRHCPSLPTGASLSQIAVQLVNSFPGVSCVLVGMRKTRYAKEIMATQGPLPKEEAYEALNAIAELISTDQLGIEPPPADKVPRHPIGRA